MEPTRANPPYRRFGLGDGLILLAALAFTIFVLRETGWFARLPNRVASWWETSLELARFRSWTFPAMTRSQAASWLAVEVVDEILIQLLSSMLLGLTLAQPLLRLRRPRPPFLDVLRQSGLAACLGVMLGTLLVVDVSWSTGIDVMDRLPVLPLVLLWPILGIPPWRSEASWIDRLGRAVGCGWIIATLSVSAIVYLV
jgi:hypothetical protein